MRLTKQKTKDYTYYCAMQHNIKEKAMTTDLNEMMESAKTNIRNMQDLLQEFLDLNMNTVRENMSVAAPQFNNGVQFNEALEQGNKNLEKVNKYWQEVGKIYQKGLGHVVNSSKTKKAEDKK
jgi:hypothetical protein